MLPADSAHPHLLTAYTLASAHALLSWRNIPCDVRINGGPWEPLGSVALLALANGSTFGRGMRIAPGADPCDGQLLAVAVTDAGILDFARRESQYVHWDWCSCEPSGVLVLLVANLHRWHEIRLEQHSIHHQGLSV